MKKISILSFLLLYMFYSTFMFAQEIVEEKKNIDNTLETTQKNNYSIIPYFGINYTNYQDKGFVGAEEIKLWKSKTNILFGVDFYKNTRILDFGFGIDISTQSITDTGSIIDSILNQEKNISTQTFPILSLYATIKKDFIVYNQNFYVSAKAGLVMNYNITQYLKKTISSGQIIPPGNIGGNTIDVCDQLGLSNFVCNQLPNSGIINIPDIDYPGYPNTDINTNLNNSLKINGSYIFGFSFGYLINNIDLSLYYNYKIFAMTGYTELILPSPNEHLFFNLNDSGNGSAIAKEIGLKIGYRF